MDYRVTCPKCRTTTTLPSFASISYGNCHRCGQPIKVIDATRQKNSKPPSGASTANAFKSKHSSQGSTANALKGLLILVLCLGLIGLAGYGLYSIFRTRPVQIEGRVISCTCYLFEPNQNANECAKKNLEEGAGDLCVLAKDGTIYVSADLDVAASRGDFEWNQKLAPHIGSEIVVEGIVGIDATRDLQMNSYIHRAKYFSLNSLRKK